jgi:hypothetical protein
MSDDKNSGPAFPWCGDLNECPTINLGMTLRDYFAAQAMQGICASGPGHHMTDDAIAKGSYSLADAMLRAAA